MAKHIDTTPSADIRETMSRGKNDASDYGDLEWRTRGSFAVSASVDVEEQVPEYSQPSLFDDMPVPMPDHLRNRVDSSKKDKYGHVEGASATELRRADEIAIKQQSRGQGSGY